MKQTVTTYWNYFVLLSCLPFIQAQPNQAPRLRTPSDHSILQVPGSQLSWEAVGNITYYKLKVDSKGNYYSLSLIRK